MEMVQKQEERWGTLFGQWAETEKHICPIQATNKGIKKKG